jgi:hypothetical protein
LHERSQVCRLLRKGDRTGSMSAPGISDAMVRDQAMTPCQRRLAQQRLEPVGEDAGVHEHDRIARADQPVFELDSFQRCTLPGLRSCVS